MNTCRHSRREGDTIIDEEGNEVDVPPEINLDAQLLIEEAREIDPTIQVGERIEKEVTPHDFGRVAAGTAKQVIMQKIYHINLAMQVGKLIM